MQRALIRFGRVILAAAIGAAIGAASAHVSDLPITPEVAVVVTAIIAAAGKWLRDHDWSNVPV